MNKNSKMGRPPFYGTPEELQAAVNRYFESCKGTPVFDENGLPVMTRAGTQKMTGETPPTITGLSRFLGFKDRHCFTRQRVRGAAFSEVVAIARLRVEAYTEARLFDPDAYKGAAFMLRTCFGWGKEEEPPAASPGVQVVIEAPAPDADPAPAAGDLSPHTYTNIELYN